jgi:hypothetical protein
MLARAVHGVFALLINLMMLAMFGLGIVSLLRLTGRGIKHAAGQGGR